MLTSKALLERKWGRFPELRKILSGCQVPSEYFGPTSVSDNIFNQLERLTEVLVIAREHRSNIEESTSLKNFREIAEDLRQLEGAARWGMQIFKDHAAAFSELANDIRCQFEKVLSVPAGISYELILEHRIYSCPSTYNYESARLLAPRTAEGSIEKIFTIRKVITASIGHLEKTQMSEEERSPRVFSMSPANSVFIYSQLKRAA